MTNKFLSGRVPPELYDAVEEYCKQTGEKRTDVIIRGVAAYINFTVTTQTTLFPSQQSAVTEERLAGLEKIVMELGQKVKVLEDLLQDSKPSVIKIDNTDNKSEELEADNTVETIDNQIKDLEIQNQEQEINEQQTDKCDNTNDNAEPESKTSDYPSFEEIVNARLQKLTNLTRRQIDRLVEKAVEKVKAQGKTIIPGQLLDEPVEVFHKDTVIHENNPYRVFYLGENSQEKPVWSLIPDDNKIYQSVIIKVIHNNSPFDNNNYHSDNNSIGIDTTLCQNSTSGETNKIKIDTDNKNYQTDNLVTERNGINEDLQKLSNFNKNGDNQNISEENIQNGQLPY